jgi:hypothetical protein
MKNVLAIVLVLATLTAYAQRDKYITAMNKNLARFDSVKTTEEYQSLAASFERIGDAEKTEWLPYYYSGLALLTPGWQDKKLDKDANAEKIKMICAKADPLTKDNADKAEVLSIRNMAATQQMLVDPQNRWMNYGQEAGAHLKKAKQLDANNPRLAYLEGASVFGTPEQFGGGKANAKPILEKAIVLFKSEQVKPMHPHWGQQQAADMLAQCQ